MREALLLYIVKKPLEAGAIVRDMIQLPLTKLNIK
jgi:hypothetical protein